MSESSGSTVMIQGRIVWTSGDLFKGRPKTDQMTKQPRIGKDGQPIIEYGFGLAVPKSAIAAGHGPGQPGEFWAAMHREAMSLYPGAQSIPPAFAMKYKDGDGIDDQGRPFAQRAGYKDCLVLACTTTLPIKYFKFDPATNKNFQVNEGIKCGDYVQVQLQIKAHAGIGNAKAGLYLNPMAVRFIGYGEPIVNTPSGDEIFGVGAPPALPPGASATPVGPAGFITAVGGQAMPGMSATPAMPPMQAPQFAPQAGVPQTPAAMPAPNYGVMPQGFQQAPQMAPPPMQMPQAGAPVMPPQMAPPPMQAPTNPWAGGQ